MLTAGKLLPPIFLGCFFVISLDFPFERERKFSTPQLQNAAGKANTQGRFLCYCGYINVIYGAVRLVLECLFNVTVVRLPLCVQQSGEL